MMDSWRGRISTRSFCGSWCFYGVRQIGFERRSPRLRRLCFSSVWWTFCSSHRTLLCPRLWRMIDDCHRQKVWCLRSLWHQSIVFCRSVPVGWLCRLLPSFLFCFQHVLLSCCFFLWACFITVWQEEKKTTNTRPKLHSIERIQEPTTWLMLPRLTGKVR